MIKFKKIVKYGNVQGGESNKYQQHRQNPIDIVYSLNYNH